MPPSANRSTIKLLARTLFTAVALLIVFATSSALGVRALHRGTSHAGRRRSHHRQSHHHDAGRLSRRRSVAGHRVNTAPATPTLPVGPPEPVELTPPTEPTPPVAPTAPALPVGPPEPVQFTPPTEPTPPVEPMRPVESPPPVEPKPPVEPPAPTPPPAPAAPVNSALPTIGGTATEGQLLSATTGAWTGSPTSYTYQWQDCSSAGASCTNVSGPTAPSYTLGSSDVGHTVRVVVTASNAGGPTPAASASVGPVSAPPPPPVESPTPFRFFSATSFWNEPLPAAAPLDPNSAAIVGAFDKEIAAAEEEKKGPANINTTAWSVPIYTVPADQPTVKVTLENASQTPALQSAWDVVPLPPDAQPAAGTDKHLVVWQPSTDRLWEFWRLGKTEAGWQASWGGAMQNASSDSGAYGPEDWPGAKPGWGASASSLSIAGGLITLEDLEMGQIDHALAMAIPHPRAGVYASPAERTDGLSTEPLSLPEGAHLRLDPNLDLAALHLPRLTLMMAEAAQRYGIFVRDTASNVAFYAQDPIPTGTEPYTGAHGYFEGHLSELLAAFPWSHLQLLKMDLHSKS
jgi:hypothetical protein